MKRVVIELYPQILDEDKPRERQWGIDAGYAWLLAAELVAVYTDRGISRGMETAIRFATEHGIHVIYRIVTDWTES